jgi:hypothetical protein
MCYIEKKYRVDVVPTLRRENGVTPLRRESVLPL